MSEFLRRFARQFSALNKDNLQSLGELYSDDIHFTDPLHEVQGLAQLRDYFGELYANVSELRFDFHGFDQIGDCEGYLRWVMSYRHRDYFDAGALLYEHLPVLGRVIAWLKRRMG
jgi:hypothetical protein